MLPLGPRPAHIPATGGVTGLGTVWMRLRERRLDQGMLGFVAWFAKTNGFGRDATTAMRFLMGLSEEQLEPMYAMFLVEREE